MDYSDLFVQVDLLGVAEANKRLRTAAVPKNSTPLDFKFSQEVEVAPGSRLQRPHLLGYSHHP